MTNSDARCRFCGNPIEYLSGPSGSFWFTPIGKPPAPGATLPIECPKSPNDASLPSRHEPAP